MKNFAIIAMLVVFAPASASAQDDSPPRSFGLDDIAPFAQGLRGLLEGLSEDMMPLMQQLGEKMSDLNAYEAPEVLPNGDIIIRRKPEPITPEPDAPKANPDGSIDL